MRRHPAALAAALHALFLSFPASAQAAPAKGVPAPAGKMPFVEKRPFAESLRRAKTEKKAVLVDVFAVWCGPCKVLDATTFSDADTTAWAVKRFVPVRVDAEKGEGRKIASRYAVTSFPTILFLDADGNEIDRMTGAHGPEAFRANGDAILAGRTPIQTSITDLKKSFSIEKAQPLVQVLAQRRDFARLKPIAQRVLEADPDLSDRTNVDVLVLYAAVSDERRKLDPELADLIASVLPKVTSDQRAFLAAVLGREYGRRGDAREARALVDATLKAVGDKTPFAHDLWAALGDAEMKKGSHDAAIAAFRKAVAVLETSNAPPALRAIRNLDLADALAAAGRKDEARKAAVTALGLVANDAAAFGRAARAAATAKLGEDALSWAKRAVDLTSGEDADAQAALATALASRGDDTGASAAWRRAADLDPDNAEYRKNAAAKKKPAA